MHIVVKISTNILVKMCELFIISLKKLCGLKCNVNSQVDVRKYRKLITAISKISTTYFIVYKLIIVNSPRDCRNYLRGW